MTSLPERVTAVETRVDNLTGWLEKVDTKLDRILLGVAAACILTLLGMGVYLLQGHMVIQERAAAVPVTASATATRSVEVP